HVAKPTFRNAVAFDTSPSLRALARTHPLHRTSNTPQEIRPERGRFAANRAFTADGALQTRGPSSASIPAPSANCEGLRNQDILDVLGFRVNPPDPSGEVGPNHYVEII